MTITSDKAPGAPFMPEVSLNRRENAPHQLLHPPLVVLVAVPVLNVHNLRQVLAHGHVRAERLLHVVHLGAVRDFGADVFQLRRVLHKVQDALTLRQLRRPAAECGGEGIRVEGAVLTLGSQVGIVAGSNVAVGHGQTAWKKVLTDEENL